jgi:hypothetical protein
MANFERRPFDENPFWDIFQTYSYEDAMGDFKDK